MKAGQEMFEAHLKERIKGLKNQMKLLSWKVDLHQEQLDNLHKKKKVVKSASYKKYKKKEAYAPYVPRRTYAPKKKYGPTPSPTKQDYEMMDAMQPPSFLRTYQINRPFLSAKRKKTAEEEEDDYLVRRAEEFGQ